MTLTCPRSPPTYGQVAFSKDVACRLTLPEFVGRYGSVTAMSPTPDALCYAHGICLHPSHLVPLLTLATCAAQRLRSPNFDGDMLPRPRFLGERAYDIHVFANDAGGAWLRLCSTMESFPHLSVSIHKSWLLVPGRYTLSLSLLYSYIDPNKPLVRPSTTLSKSYFNTHSLLIHTKPLRYESLKPKSACARHHNQHSSCTRSVPNM
jgi:hypothetical protein